jgi:4'-phosphopantetheinyl transferase
MTAGARWFQAPVDQVPDDDDWLTGEERAVMTRLTIAKRRSDWRLGRWVAKSLVADVIGTPAHRVVIRAADDGAPEAFVDGAPSGLSLSLSHRDGVGVAAIGVLPTRVGVDLETLEPRSDAFVRDWLADEEQAKLPIAGPARDLQVLCCWTGKEASAKARREGLRLDVRHAVVEAGASVGGGGWAPLVVTWRTECIAHHGWWRHDERQVIAVVTEPPSDPPSRGRKVSGVPNQERDGAT